MKDLKKMNFILLWIQNNNRIYIYIDHGVEWETQTQKSQAHLVISNSHANNRLWDLSDKNINTGNKEMFFHGWGIIYLIRSRRPTCSIPGHFCVFYVFILGASIFCSNNKITAIMLTPLWRGEPENGLTTKVPSWYIFKDCNI